MHQSFDEENKNFSLGDIVELDNGMPDFERLVGFGVVVAVGPKDNLMDGEVIVHWQSDVWAAGRQQKMSLCEIRLVTLP